MELLSEFYSGFLSLRKVTDFLNLVFIVVFGKKLFSALTKLEWDEVRN